MRRLLTLTCLTLLVGLLTACSPTPVSTASCSQAFEELPAVDHDAGIFTLVSDKFAMTLTQCGSASEWKAELAKRPEVVGETVISDDYLDEFFTSACGFLAEMGHSSRICTK